MFPNFWPFCSGCNVLTHSARQDGRYFADDVLKCIFFNENVWISLKIPLKFVPRGPINNIPALVQIMAWRRPGDKPLSEPMLVFVPTHKCVTRPQWVNPIDSPDQWCMLYYVQKSHFDGLVQDCSISSVLGLEILQFITKLSICC